MGGVRYIIIGLRGVQVSFIPNLKLPTKLLNNLDIGGGGGGEDPISLMIQGVLTVFFTPNFSLLTQLLKILEFRHAD